MYVYILHDKDLGSQVLYGPKMNCKEFLELTNKLAKEYGDDVYILKDLLIEKYGFKKGDIQCVYLVKR